VVGRQPYAPAAFTPGETPVTHFQRLSRPQGTWFCRWEPRKYSPVTPPRIGLWSLQLVAQCLNHYATSKIHLIKYNLLQILISYVFRHLFSFLRECQIKGITTRLYTDRHYILHISALPLGEISLDN